MNLDDQEDPYSYTQVENLTPTMNFQTEQLFGNFDKLVEMTSNITRENYVRICFIQAKTTVLDYLDLICGMIKNRRFAQTIFDRNKCLETLLVILFLPQKVYLREGKSPNGIIKNKITTLIEKLTDSSAKQPSQLSKLQEKAIKFQGNAQNKCFS